MQSIKKQVEYWSVSAEDNLQTAEYLFKGSRFDACLFFCHLSLEKLLKGLVVEKTREAAPHIHDLERLAVIAGLTLSKKETEDLKAITRFNLAGRYMEIKTDFHKVCTQSYTERYLKISQQLFIWLENLYQKK